MRLRGITKKGFTKLLAVFENGTFAAFEDGITRVPNSNDVTIAMSKLPDELATLVVSDANSVKSVLSIRERDEDELARQHSTRRQ